MFLELIEYKLKNRIYHKVEHAVQDFRRIINNAKLDHQVKNRQFFVSNFFIFLIII